MQSTSRLLAAALTAAALSLPTAVSASDIHVQNPWARASAGMAGAGAAFMAITNGGEADRLVAASAEVSKKVELHTHIKEGEVMKMRRVDAIDIPANDAVHLKPGGLHVMFIGLEEPLQEGQSFPLTLVFENAGEVIVDVQVEKAAAMGHAHGHGDMKTKSE